MRTQIITRLCRRYFLSYFPEFQSKGRILYNKDFHHLLRGFYFESSSFSTNLFTIEVFVQPLYIPDESISFTFGDRLGMIAKRRDIWWEYDETREKQISDEILPMLTSAGVRYLDQRKSIEQFVAANECLVTRDNKYIQEAIGYGYILMNDTNKAMELLNHLYKMLSTDTQKDPSITWVNEQKNRVRLILRHLEEQDNKGAEQLLQQWRNYSVAHLKL